MGPRGVLMSRRSPFCLRRCRQAAAPFLETAPAGQPCPPRALSSPFTRAEAARRRFGSNVFPASKTFADAPAQRPAKVFCDFGHGSQLTTRAPGVIITLPRLPQTGSGRACAEVAEWQTRRSQKPLGATSWGFESPLRHHDKQAACGIHEAGGLFSSWAALRSPHSRSDIVPIKPPYSSPKAPVKPPQRSLIGYP